MNKVILIDRNEFVHGNTVLVPQRETSKSNEYEELLKAKKRNLRLKTEKRIKSRLKVIRNIALIFVIGIIMVGRYCIIYNMQTNLNSIKSEIADKNRQNENLKVELVKYSNLQYIEDKAVNSIHMIQPEKNSIIYMDLSTNNFNETDKKDGNDGKQKTIINEIINSIF